MTNPYFDWPARATADRFVRFDVVRASDLNNALDDLSAGLGKFPNPLQLWGNTANYAVASGSVDAWTVTVAASYITSYVDGLRLNVRFPAASTVAVPTINVNGLGAKAIALFSGGALGVGDIAADRIYTLIYSTVTGKFHVLQLPVTASAAASTYGSTTVADMLDAVSFASYADLRAYGGLSKKAYISGYIAATTPAGIGGLFTLDESDWVSVDNGGTTLIDALGRRWKRVYSGPVNVAWFASGNGTDETAKFALAVAASKHVMIPSGMTLAISDCAITTDLHLRIDTGATLKHFSGSAVRMLYSTAALKISGGGTIDGNKAGQTGRPDCVRFAGSTIDVSGVTFTNTVQAGVMVWSATGDVRITENLFWNMAEHTGVLGQGSQAIYIGDVSEPASTLVAFNRVIADTPSVVGRSPGGIQVAVSNAATMSASCRIIGNYFYKIGMAAAGNFLGCVDLYTHAKSTVVSGNVCILPAYAALKLQNAPGLSCSANVVRGFSGDTSTSKPMILIDHARSLAADVYGASVTGNVVDLTGDTTQICIQVSGDSTTLLHPQKGVAVSGNTCVGGARGIGLYYIGDVAVTGNTIRDASQAIRFVDMNDLGGRVNISSNSISNSAYGIIASGSKMKDAAISVVGNIFADITTAAVSLISDAARVMKAVNVQSNTFINPPTGSFNIDVRYATDVLVQGNAGQPLFPTTFTTVTKTVENDNSWNVAVYSGAGSPEGVLTAKVGALYQRTDGSTGFTLYTKESGTGNTGWNAVPTLLLGAAVYDPPNLAAGATQQTTVTVTGATTSDGVVSVSHSAGNTDSIWFGEVTSADTVTVTQWNRSAGAVDVGNGNLRVRVIKN